MKKCLSILLAAVMAFSLCACGGSGTKTETAAAGSETAAAEDGAAEAAADGVAADSDITILDYSDISTLYPLDIGTNVDMFPVFCFYDPLLRMDPDGNYIWMLATGCDRSDDGLEYVFTLREGVTFSDGTPWNAEACKANLDVMADQSNGYRSQFMYECIDSVEAVDDYTVKVTLSQVYAPFLNALAIEPAAMVSPALLAQGDEVLASTVAGTGQYTLVERKTGEYTKMALNRDWWGYEAGIVEMDYGFNTITVKPVSEEATRVAMLMSGEADIIMNLTANNINTVKAQNMNVVMKSGAMMSYLYLNCQKEVLSDVRVRKALAMAIDLDALNNVVYGGDYEVATSPLMSCMQFFKAQTPYEYNVEAAKELLAEAGYGDGLTLVCWEENDTTDIQRGEFIQQQLEQIGITLEIYPQEGGFLTDNVNGFSGDPKDAEFDCYIRGYGVDTADADEAIGRFASNAFPPMGANYSFWCNEEFDKAIEEGAGTIDTDVRAAAYEKAQEIFWDEVPSVCLLSVTYNAGYNGRVEGLDFGTSGLLYLPAAKYVAGE